MNAALLAQTAYGNKKSPTKPPRELEYDAFVRITGLLKRAETFPEIAHAVDRNRALWTILARDLSGEGNKLPQSLRAELLSLAHFTIRHSRSVMQGSATVEALIEVNTNIMKGLRGTKAAAP